MLTSNIFLGKNVDINPFSSVNNVLIGDNVKIAKGCTIFGGPENLVEIGDNSYIGAGVTISGYSAQIKIGKNCAIGQQSYFMSDSAPHTSKKLLKLFPKVIAPTIIGDDVWMGVGCIIMPGVTIGECCVIAANSFINKDIPPYSIYGGNPARLIRAIDPKELE